MRAPDKILIIQLRRIGDVLLTTPAARALRRAFPGAKIDFLAEPPCCQVLINNPDISEVLDYDPRSALKWLSAIRSRKYDWVVDFLGNPRSALITALSGATVRAGQGHVFHRWAYNVKFARQPDGLYTATKKVAMLKLLGINGGERAIPEITLTDQTQDYKKQVLSQLGFGHGRPVVGFAPASRRITRKWPAEHYSQLGKLLHSRHNCEIVVFWGPGEKELAEEIVSPISDFAKISPKTENLSELAALLTAIRLLVTNFNGTMHIAAAVGTPTLGIYGMCAPSDWRPADDPRHQAIGADELDCISCDSTTCDKGLICMKTLVPSRVFEKAAKMLEQYDRIFK